MNNITTHKTQNNGDCHHFPAKLKTMVTVTISHCKGVISVLIRINLINIMEKMDKWMTKRNIAIIGITGVLAAYFLQHFYDFFWTLSGLRQHTYIAIYKSIIWFSIPLTIAILILIFLRDEIFQSWRKFAYQWVPLQFIIISLIIYTEKDSIGGFMSMHVAEPTSMFLSGVFLVVSLVLIISKYITLQKKS
jgi:hypothetical protein